MNDVVTLRCDSNKSHCENGLHLGKVHIKEMTLRSVCTILAQAIERLTVDVLCRIDLQSSSNHYPINAKSTPNQRKIDTQSRTNQHRQKSIDCTLQKSRLQYSFKPRMSAIKLLTI
jgi:hypothetical protein